MPSIGTLFHSYSCDNLSNSFATACHGLQVFHFSIVVRSSELLSKLSKITNPWWPFLSCHFLSPIMYSVQFQAGSYQAKRFSIAESLLIQGITRSQKHWRYWDQWAGKVAARSKVLNQVLNVKSMILSDCSTWNYNLEST